MIQLESTNILRLKREINVTFRDYAFAMRSDVASSEQEMTMDICNSPISCGIDLLFNLSGSSPKTIIYDLYDYYQNYDRLGADCNEVPNRLHSTYPAIILFSDVSGQNGDKLCAFINTHKLGKCKQVNCLVNPNTKNHIALYSWVVNKQAIIAWVHEK